MTKLVDDPHGLFVAKMLIFSMLTKENYGEDELARKISIHTDYIFEDIKFVIWLLKGEGSIIRINGGLGINPFGPGREIAQYAFTTTRNISPNLGKTT